MNIAKTQPHDTEAVATVRRYLAAFGQGDVERAMACVHQDAVWHIDGDPAVTTVGILRGHAQIRGWIARFPLGFTPLAFSVERLIDAGSDVIALGRFRHRVVASSAIVDSDYAIRFTVREQRIARYQIFEDSLLLAQAHASASPARSVAINQMHYGWEDVGQGPALIFLHGLFLDRSFWAQQIATLQGNYRCIAFDMPGHGATGWRTGLDLDLIADDLALWLQEHGIKHATWIGHSQGGMIAMRLAARHPALVERLVLVNTSAREEYPERIPAWHRREQALLGSDAERLAMFKEIQGMKAAGAWLAAHPQAAQQELANMMAQDPEGLAAALRAAVIQRRDIRPLIGAICAPTVVLSGGQDRATPAELGLEIASLIPAAEHLLVPDAGHSIPVEQPQALLAAITGR